MTQTYINGSFLPSSEAFMPVTDRGLRFGDGVFETIAIHNGKIYQLNKHIERLQYGMSQLGIVADIKNLADNANKLIQINKVDKGLMRITVTRGSESIGYLPAEKTYPNIIIETLPPRNISGKKAMSLVVSQIQKPTIKSLPIDVKTLNGLNSVYARMDAAQHNCNEALLLGSNQQICEGSSSNIFWFKDDILYTPSLESGILAGTTRDIVIELSPYKVQESIYYMNDFIDADEIFMTSVSLPVMAVEKLLLQDGQEIMYNQHPKSDEIRKIILSDIKGF